jgi:hypothetical protein
MSLPEVDVHFCVEDSGANIPEEDYKSNTSKTSTSKNSIRNHKQPAN